MVEQIYTIPVNEGFDNAIATDKCNCPFCMMHDMLEKNEIETILGASMMEPDIRIETNKKGFCRHHFDKMFAKGNKLGLALILESHVAQVEKDCLCGGSLFDSKGEKECEKLNKLENSCYICDRIDNNLNHMVDTAIWLWEREEEFKDKVKNQQFFCLPHYRMFVTEARKSLDKKDFIAFYKVVSTIEKNYIKELGSDVSWFCKKFDYRYDSEPWYNAKDSISRSINFLSSGKNID